LVHFSVNQPKQQLFAKRSKQRYIMCQIVSGNRSDVDDLPITSLSSRRFPRRPISIGDSKDILLCPVMSKISFPPKGSAAATTTARKADSLTPTVKFLPNNEEKHSCLICSQFVEDEENAVNRSLPQNAEVTLQSVFKYVKFLFINLFINVKRISRFYNV
jgi:hypothetical protein